MAVEALCPTCGAVFSLKEEYLGKKVRCKKCEHVFTVGGDKVKERDADGAVQAGAAPSRRGPRDEDDEDRTTRKAPARRGRDGEDEDDDRPRKRPARGREDDYDDDDDRDGGRKRKRVYHDDDYDDDDDDRRGARRRPQSGGAGKVIAIVGGVVFLVILVCGGAIYGIYRAVQTADDIAADKQQELADQFQQAMNEAAKQDPNFAFDRQPKDVADALTMLKGNVAADRRGAARWLARQSVDNGRRKEVATALEPLLKDDEGTCAAAASALKVWGTRDNGPALTAALKQKQEGGIPGDPHKALMAAIGAVKYEPGADEILRFLPNFFVGEDALRALADLGPPAKKSVLKHMNSKDTATRDRARRLLQGYNTQPAEYLDQVVEDLGSVEQERNKNAAEWLNQPASNAALDLAKAEPARREAVAKGLNRLIDSPPAFFEDTLLNVVRRWGTKDNVPSLIHLMTTNPFKKRETADALIAIGPACEPEVKKLLDHGDNGVREQAKRVIASVGSPAAKFDGLLVDLKSEDGGRIREAAITLQRASVDNQQRAQVVAALVATMNNTGPGRTDGDCALDVAKAVVVWATKDDAGEIAEKLRGTNKFFTKQSRPLLFEWMGKQKAEKAIPFLAGGLADKDDWQNASKALQAMGPELGEMIEEKVWQLQLSGNQLIEGVKVLGAVGTKKVSLPKLKTLQVAALKKDQALADACAAAITSINAR